MERDGWLKAEWGEAGGRRRKYYKLTAQGKKALDAKRTGWAKFTAAVGGMVKGNATSTGKAGRKPAADGGAA